MKNKLREIGYYGFRVDVILSTLLITGLLIAGMINLGMHSVRWCDAAEAIAFIITSDIVLVFILGQIKLVINVWGQIASHWRTKKLHNSKVWQERVIQIGGTIDREGTYYPFLEN